MTESRVSSPLRSVRTPLLMVAAALGGPLLLAAPAAAHTGRPAGGVLDGAVHPLLGLDHLLVMVAVGVLAATAPDRRVAWLVPVTFVGGVLAGGVAGLSGFEVSALEALIAASLVVLGGLLVTPARSRALWLPLVVAASGAPHGFAHGSELPVGATPVAYVAGLVAMTATLHLTGYAAGSGVRRRPAIRITAGAGVAAAGLALLVVI